MVLSMGTGSNEFVALIWLRDLLGFKELLKLSLEIFIFFIVCPRKFQTDQSTLEFLVLF